MIAKAKLNTLNMYDNFDHNDKDFLLWKKIAEYMDGEEAFIYVKGYGNDNEHLFLGLTDKEKDKELWYMMEQDSMTGVFINDREGFDRAWDSGEYESYLCYYLKAKYLTILEDKE